MAPPSGRPAANGGHPSAVAGACQPVPRSSSSSTGGAQLGSPAVSRPPLQEPPVGPWYISSPCQSSYGPAHSPMQLPSFRGPPPSFSWAPANVVSGSRPPPLSAQPVPPGHAQGYAAAFSPYAPSVGPAGQHGAWLPPHASAGLPGRLPLASPASAQHFDASLPSPVPPLGYGQPVSVLPTTRSEGFLPPRSALWPRLGYPGAPSPAADDVRAAALVQDALGSAIDGPIDQAWADLLSPLGSGGESEATSSSAGRTDRPGHQAGLEGAAYVLAPPSSSSGPQGRSAGLGPSDWLTDDAQTAFAQAPDGGDKAPTGRQDPAGLDVYADTFLPQFLRDLDLFPPTYVHPLAPLPSFPPTDYTSSFYPSALLAPPIRARLLATAPPRGHDRLPALTASTYGTRFGQLLALELAAQSRRGRSLVLYKLPVVLLDASLGDEAGALVCMHVPGVRENWPQVSVGDACLLREVWVDWATGSDEGLMGRVVSVGKREGFVYLRVPNLIPYLASPLHPFPVSLEALLLRPTSRAGDGRQGNVCGAFNCLFFPSPLPTLEQAAAVDLAAGILGTSAPATTLLSNGKPAEDADDRSAVLRHWLFPEPADADPRMPVRLKAQIDKGDWVDSNLNEEQRAAVRVGALYRSRVPLLVSGPFGTGKTKMVTELALQILRVQLTATILLVAPSNSATDTLCLRLLKALGPGQRPSMLRLNDRERTFAEVPETILPYCFVEGDHFAVPPFAQLMRYRIVLTSAADAAILSRAHVSNRDLGALERGVASAIHPHDAESRPAVRPHWTHLIVDEAGQGSEPELLVPVSVVLPFENTSVENEPQLVLCGDGQQLGPLICSDAARSGELDVSLLERLFERPLYVSSTASSGDDWQPCSRLVKNYRCHPALLMTPSTLFYDDALEPRAQNGVVRWSRLPNADLPLVVLNTPGLDGSLDDGASWFNLAEINEIVAVVRSLLDPAESGGSTPPIRIGDIGVMACFREQVWRLRERLRSEGFGGIDVGSVEDYQGRETRITIVSTVRSRARFLPKDMAKSLGLVFEQKRFNVAITRAKEALIIVGNAEILARDPYWRGLLHFALRNGLLAGPPIALEGTNERMSLLESAYLAEREAHRRGSVFPAVVDRGEPDAHDLLSSQLSGALARTVLQEGSGR